MTESLVRQARDGDVAIVTLNRPARHNALVPELLTALLAALDDVAAGDAAALVLASEGRSFSTGGDLRGFLEHRESIGAYADLLVGLLNDVILALYRLPFPTVCAVSGQVCGGSLGLLLACDRVVMQQDAGIAPWYRAVGFSPDGGWTAAVVEVTADLGRAIVVAGKITEQNGLPVLLLIDRTMTTDIVGESGFADFVLSPVDRTELRVRLGRLHSSLPAVADDDTIRFRDLELNTATYQALVGGEPRNLTFMEKPVSMRRLVAHVSNSLEAPKSEAVG